VFRFVFLLILLAAIVYLILRFTKITAEQKKRYLKSAVVAGLFALLAVLVLTGRLNWLLAAAGALLPLLPKAGRLLFGLWPRILPYFRRYQQNKHSSMQTPFILLQIDLITGELKGEVLQGRFKGQKLQSLSLQNLLDVLDECKQHDENSVRILMSFLDRAHPGWTARGDAGQGTDQGGRYKKSSSSADINMDIQQARAILGVSENSSKKEIIKAHKRLMQKLHPDRGGSDYLAKQINRAKDLLLQSL